MRWKKGFTIALASGDGLWQRKTKQLLDDSRIKVHRKHPRSCMADVSGFPCLKRAVFCKPKSIPELVADGDVELGIVGMDTVREHGGADANLDDRERLIEICAELPYSRATEDGIRSVLFTTERNTSVKSSFDLPSGYSIVTEHPRETADFLGHISIQRNDIRLVECSGSAEALVAVGKYCYGVTLVETGDTLRANGLREIQTVFTSSTALIAYRDAISTGEAREKVGFLARLLRGTLDARNKTYLVMNAPASQVELIKAVLPSLKSPTIQPLGDPLLVSIAAVVPTDNLNQLMFELEKLGASDFIPLPPSTVM